LYLWNPKLNIYYVAAKETMQAGLLTRIMAYGGAITVERTWRVKERMSLIKKTRMTENIKIALNDGWVITFPQGTTKSFKPVRKGQHI
jgi:1-acyl-sn-glycerol-3-phosphate acyltransferase